MHKNMIRPFAVLSISLACATILTACPHGRGEGPAERVGKTMDKGAAAVGRGVEKTGDVIEDTAEGR